MEGSSTLRVQVPSHIQVQRRNLVVKLDSVEDLPRMDHLGAGCDPYLLVQIGSKVVKSSVKKGGRASFGETLALVLDYPAMSMLKRLRLTLMDFDRASKDDIIATTYIDLDSIEKGHWRAQRWICFYGSALGQQLHQNAERINLGQPTDDSAVASTYRGRALLSIYLDDALPVPNDSHLTRNVQRKQVPLTADNSSIPVDAAAGDTSSLCGEGSTTVNGLHCCMRADIFSATDLPAVGSHHVRVRFLIGNMAWQTSKVTVQNGVADWFESLGEQQSSSLSRTASGDESPSRFSISQADQESTNLFALTSTSASHSRAIQIPRDPTQSPDLIVAITVSSEVTWFHRIPMYEVLRGSCATPHWQSLQYDCSLASSSSYKNEAPQLLFSFRLTPVCPTELNPFHCVEPINYAAGCAFQSLTSHDIVLSKLHIKGAIETAALVALRDRSDAKLYLEVKVQGSKQAKEHTETIALHKSSYSVASGFELAFGKAILVYSVQPTANVTLLLKVDCGRFFSDQILASATFSLGNLMCNSKNDLEHGVEVDLEMLPDPSLVDELARQNTAKATGDIVPSTCVNRSGLHLRLVCAYADQRGELSPQSSVSTSARRKLAHPPSCFVELHATVFRAWGLPSSDRNALSDPYVRLQWSGIGARSPTREKTCNPVWGTNFSLRLQVPQQLELAPHFQLVRLTCHHRRHSFLALIL